MKFNSINELIAAYKRGEREAVNQVFRLYYTNIRYYIKRRVNDEDAVNEITQQVFINVLNKCQQFDSLEYIKAYLYVTALNGCRSYYRNLIRKGHTFVNFSPAEIDEKDFDAGSCDPHQTDDVEAALLKIIWECVEALPPRCREIFKKHYLAGKSDAAIAAEMEVAMATVRSQRRRGLALLRQLIAEKTKGTGFLFLVMTMMEWLR